MLRVQRVDWVTPRVSPLGFGLLWGFFSQCQLSKPLTCGAMTD